MLFCGRAKTTAELEKVQNALENCTAKPKCMDCGWKECEYEHETVEIPLDLAKTALSLLKAQAPILVADIAEATLGCKPKVKVGHCPLCGVLMSETDRFCRKCGQAVKWE